MNVRNESQIMCFSFKKYKPKWLMVRFKFFSDFNHLRKKIFEKIITKLEFNGIR
jgi:hypothetical protein